MPSSVPVTALAQLSAAQPKVLARPKISPKVLHIRSRTMILTFIIGNLEQSEFLLIILGIIFLASQNFKKGVVSSCVSFVVRERGKESSSNETRGGIDGLFGLSIPPTSTPI